MKTINDFAMLAPMKYYNNETDCPKRQDMIDNKDNLYIATCKKDGDWAMLIHYSKGNNLIRSRSISKVTGVYGDYTAKLPHICEAMDLLPDSTVLLAELCWDEPGTNANTVGTILRCLPAKAVERQKEKKLKAVVFDCLMYDGIDIVESPYIIRLHHILNICFDTSDNNLMRNDYGKGELDSNPYIYPTQVYDDNFAETADKIINEGGEGLVIQLKNNPYMPGTRTAWKTLKLKQKLPEMELKVIGTIDPKEEYEGDCPEAWPYYKLVRREVIAEDGTSTGEWVEERYLVTKPYYYGWKNGIKVQLENGIVTDITSGLTDEDREWLASEDAVKMIAAGELYAVIKAMSINDLGKLRHGYLVRLRNDM